MLLKLQRYEFEISYKKGPSLLMADPLSCAYLSLKKAIEDQKDVMVVPETRSSTEIQAEQVNTLQYLPVTFGKMIPSAKSKTLLKKMLFSRPSLESSNKAGQKVSSVSRRKFKTTFLSKKSLHFKMELFSRDSRHTISNER